LKSLCTCCCLITFAFSCRDQMIDWIVLSRVSLYQDQLIDNIKETSPFFSVLDLCWTYLYNTIVYDDDDVYLEYYGGRFHINYSIYMSLRKTHKLVQRWVTCIFHRYTVPTRFLHMVISLCRYIPSGESGRLRSLLRLWWKPQILVIQRLVGRIHQCILPLFF
jgi:hypothetical protein